MVDVHFSKQTQVPVYLCLLITQTCCRIYGFIAYPLYSSFVESRQMWADTFRVNSSVVSELHSFGVNSSVVSELHSFRVKFQPNAMPGWGFFNFLLFLLLILHLYWLSVIVKIGLYLLYTGTSRDLQVLKYDCKFS